MLDNIPHLYPIFLALSLLTLLSLPKKYLIGLYIITILIGLFLNSISALTLIPIVLIALGSHLWGQPSKKYIRVAGGTVFFLTSLGLLLHMFPGFNNFLFFDKIILSPQSSPYTMYLNFDKPLIGFALLIFSGLGLSKIKPHLTDQVCDFSKISLLMLPTLIGSAIIGGFIAPEYKLHNYWYIWALNNLFIVCLAEEALFRVFIIESIKRIPSERLSSDFIALCISSLLFGLAHFKGGLLYIALSTLAGAFYGFIYLKYRHIGYSMALHFLLNLIHFIYFTYPFKA